MRIYAYVVTYPDAIPIREHTTTTARNNSIVRESWFFSPPLVRSCRKAEKDAAPLFYANNSFRAELTCGDTSTLLTWLVNISPRYLALVPKLIISLEMRSFFDIDNMRKDFECSGRTLPSTAVTSKCITNRGISADRILMVSPELKHLAKDARLLGRGVRDAETLREQWLDELQTWLDHDEYAGMTPGEAASYTLVTGKMEALLREEGATA